MTVTEKRGAGGKLLTRHASWTQDNPEAVEAHRLLARAFPQGPLDAQPCTNFGDPCTEVQRHRSERRLEVTWLFRRRVLRRHHLARNLCRALTERASPAAARSPAIRSARNPRWTAKTLAETSCLQGEEAFGNVT
jgi:hypothetical protein